MNELTKRIQEKAHPLGTSKRADENKLRVTIDDVYEILDEAKKEYLKNIENWKKDHWNTDYHGDLLAMKQEDWFKKWFGTQLNASMPQTVAGGCAGHIDLGKLQDIEKEPDLSKVKPAPFVGTVTKEE